MIDSRYDCHSRQGMADSSFRWNDGWGEVIYGHAWALGPPRARTKRREPISLKALRQGLRKGGRRD